MQELVKKVEKFIAEKEKFTNMVINSELDIDQMDAMFKKFERKIANLRNELEVEDFLLFGAKGKEQHE